MAIWNIILTALLFVWDLFKQWLLIFISPKENFEILWIIIPIWLGWFFAEFYQEKKGTSLGNAISNGGVMLWVGIDWIRYLLRMITNKAIIFDFLTASKFALSVLVLGIGLFIVIEGIKTKRFVHFVGRIRETTYVLVMFSPIIYGIIQPTWRTILAVVVFAPLFYYFIEFIDKFLPTPKVYKKDENGFKRYADTIEEIKEPFGSPPTEFQMPQDRKPNEFAPQQTFPKPGRIELNNRIDVSKIF